MKNFNPSSPQQVSEVFKKLGIKTEVLETGHMSVSKKVLEKIKSPHPFLKSYREWKVMSTNLKNYLVKFKELGGMMEVIHAGYNPAFQVTGRISATNPPATNIPRNPEIRGMVISRFAGGKILALDYRQLEMRLIASEAQEEVMLKMFEEGKDVHDETAKLMFGGSFSEAQRSIAKNINFGTVYGISSYSLSDKFNVPQRKAEDFIARHKKVFPKVYTWMQSQHDVIRRGGAIASRLGQIRHFAAWAGAGESEKEHILRQGGNFPIQHLGAALTHLGAWEIDRRLDGYKSIIFHEVHDALLIDLHPKDKAAEVQELCREVMEKYVPAKYAPFLTVPLPVEAKITTRWGEK